MYRKFTYLCFGVLVCAIPAAAQESGGASLNGTVTDPTGASIAGAKVTARQTATDALRTTQTSSAGLYSFTALAAGTYDVTVEAAGFKQAKFTAVPVSVGAVVTLDAHLEVGATQETVDVTADAPVIETSRSQTSTVVNQKAIADLPINGRNFLDFAVLTPGVVRDPTRGGDLSFRRPARHREHAAGGRLRCEQRVLRPVHRTRRHRPQSVQLQPGRGAGVPGEHQRLPAEIGRAGGGVINVITKTGTNDFHGTRVRVLPRQVDEREHLGEQPARRSEARLSLQPVRRQSGRTGREEQGVLLLRLRRPAQHRAEPRVPSGRAAPSDALSQQGAPMLQPYLASYPERAQQ